MLFFKKHTSTYLRKELQICKNPNIYCEIQLLKKKCAREKLHKLQQIIHFKKPLGLDPATSNGQKPKCPLCHNLRNVQLFFMDDIHSNFKTIFREDPSLFFNISIDLMNYTSLYSTITVLMNYFSVFYHLYSPDELLLYILPSLQSL